MLPRGSFFRCSVRDGAAVTVRRSTLPRRWWPESFYPESFYMVGEQTLSEYCQLHEVWPDTLWWRDDPLPNSKSDQVRIRLEPELFHDLVLMESDSSR